MAPNPEDPGMGGQNNVPGFVEPGGNREPAAQNLQPHLHDGGVPVGAIRTVTVRAAPFWKECPAGWFCLLEASFDAQHITADSTKYHSLLSGLDSECSRELLDVLQRPPPTNRYEHLKGVILDRFGDSTPQRLHKLLSGLTMGSKTPAQLLRHMRNLAGPNIDEEALRVRWLDLLPPTISRTLRLFRDSTLDNLASAADDLYEASPDLCAVGRECAPQPARRAPSPEPPQQSRSIDMLNLAVGQLTVLMKEVLEELRAPRQDNRSRFPYRGGARGRSRSQTPGLCYYHAQFGAAAEKCRLPCSFGPRSGN